MNYHSKNYEALTHQLNFITHHIRLETNFLENFDLRQILAKVDLSNAVLKKKSFPVLFGLLICAEKYHYGVMPIQNFEIFSYIYGNLTLNLLNYELHIIVEMPPVCLYGLFLKKMARGASLMTLDISTIIYFPNLVIFFS